MNRWAWGLVFFAIISSAISPLWAGDQPATIQVLSPADFQVFQRTSRSKGTIFVNANLNGTATAILEARVVGTAADGNWRPVETKHDAYKAELDEPAGGWYRVELRARDHDQALAQASVEHVGVGEVFVVGGQSNSTCWGEKRQQSTSGLVSNFDGKNWTLAADPLPGVDGKGGSPWPIFGDAMAAKFGVPIGIAPVGKGSTSVRQWLPKGDVMMIEPARDYGIKKVEDGKWESEGLLFDRMVERMKQFGKNGFRAMLWHQGESDAHQAAGHTLPGTIYREDLKRIIRESRTQVGWQVPWFVAQVSWGTLQSPADPDIRAAQKAIWDDGVAMPGPDTDTLIGENRQKNGTGVHMSDKGLHAHAQMWVEKVGRYLEQTFEAK